MLLVALIRLAAEVLVVGDLVAVVAAVGKSAKIAYV